MGNGSWLVWFCLCLIAASCGDGGGGLPRDGGVDGDAPPGAGDAGPAGDGGLDGDAPAASAWCDDQNPCTDDRVEAGACRFVPAEDGRACDDRDLCTLGDSCHAARCIAGGRSSGPLARLGTLDSLAGGAIGAVGDRFLAVTGSSRSARLRLAERQGASLRVVAAWDGTLEFLFASDVLIQPLGGDLVALGGRQERALTLFSLASAPSIVKRGGVVLDGQIISLAGRGSRVWACTRDFLRGHEVALVDARDPDAPVIAGSIRMPTDCGSIDTSDDGTRVYVNTRDGVRFIDAAPLDTGGAPTLVEVFAPTAGVSTAAGHLVLRGASAVRILRQRDHVEEAVVPAAGVLAASLVGARLLVEGWRTTASGGMEAYAALYDALGATPAARLDEVILQRVSFQGDVGSSFRNAVTADGAALITGTGQRWFALVGGRFEERRTPLLTPLDDLVRAAPGVRAVGFAGSAQIDVGDPLQPVFTGGGAFGVPLTLDVTLEDSAPSPQLMFGDRADVPGRSGVGRRWEPDPLPIDRWRLGADGRPQQTGRFLLPNRGAGQLLTAGAGLYRMQFPAAPSFGVALQGWPLAALGAAGEQARPAFELRLAPSPPFAIATGSGRSAFDVDPRARLAVVITGTGGPGGEEGAVFWIDLSVAPPKLVEEVHLAARPDEIRIAGTRAVVSTHLDLVWLELGKGVIARTEPTREPYIEQLLGFDGRVAYYAIRDFADGQFVGLGVSAFGDGGPAAALLPLDDAPSTMVETAGALIVGFPNQLVTVRPHCE